MAPRIMYGLCERCGQRRAGPVPAAKTGGRRGLFTCSVCLDVQKKQKSSKRR